MYPRYSINPSKNHLFILCLLCHPPTRPVIYSSYAPQPIHHIHRLLLIWPHTNSPACSSPHLPASPPIIHLSLRDGRNLCFHPTLLRQDQPSQYAEAEPQSESRGWNSGLLTSHLRHQPDKDAWRSLVTQRLNSTPRLPSIIQCLPVLISQFIRPVHLQSKQ